MLQTVEPSWEAGGRLVEPCYGSQITTKWSGRVVHRAEAGEPPPLRGAARVLRRRTDPCPSGRAVRLHPLGDGEPGARVPGRQARSLRRAAQARPAAGGGAGQGPGPGPGDRTASPGAVHLRDLRPAGSRRQPAQPHQRQRDPHRGRVRAAAAPPAASVVALTGHPRARHRPAPHREAGLRGLAGHGRDRQGRAVAAAPRPDRPRPARPGPAGRLPQHPRRSRTVVAVVAAGCRCWR